jgi:hypothetical protein
MDPQLRAYWEIAILKRTCAEHAQRRIQLEQNRLTIRSATDQIGCRIWHVRALQATRRAIRDCERDIKECLGCACGD